MYLGMFFFSSNHNFRYMCLDFTHLYTRPFASICCVCVCGGGGGGKRGGGRRRRHNLLSDKQEGALVNFTQ